MKDLLDAVSSKAPFPFIGFTCGVRGPHWNALQPIDLIDRTRSMKTILLLALGSGKNKNKIKCHALSVYESYLQFSQGHRRAIICPKCLFCTKG